MSRERLQQANALLSLLQSATNLFVLAFVREVRGVRRRTVVAATS